jgi:hypothetical protein
MARLPQGALCTHLLDSSYGDFKRRHVRVRSTQRRLNAQSMPLLGATVTIIPSLSCQQDRPQSVVRSWVESHRDRTELRAIQ